MRINGPKITSAHVISLIALFVALGGTVYAASSINGKSIKKGSIPANRLKKDSLTGAQVKESSLGTVPQAASAATAANATEAAHAASATNATNATNAVNANKATTATTATNATNATNATTATSAITASSANNASNSAALQGQPASAFQSVCANGVIKGVARVNENNGPGAALVNGYNCSGGPILITPVINPTTNQPTAQYEVDFAGLDNLQSALVSDIRLRVEVDVEGEGAGKFLVTTRNVGNGTDVNNDQFTIVVF